LSRPISASGISGSRSNTSSPAAKISPVRSASASAASSTIGPRCIDQHRRRLHRAERLCVELVVGLRRQRGVHRDDIRFGQQLLRRDRQSATETLSSSPAQESLFAGDRGVPWGVRQRSAGSGPAGGVTDALTRFTPATLTAAGEDARRPEPTLVRCRLGRSDGVTISIQAKEPGRRPISRPISLAVDFDGVFGHRQDAYERLIDDVLDGTNSDSPARRSSSRSGASSPRSSTWTPLRCPTSPAPGAPKLLPGSPRTSGTRSV